MNTHTHTHSYKPNCNGRGLWGKSKKGSTAVGFDFFSFLSSTSSSSYYIRISSDDQYLRWYTSTRKGRNVGAVNIYIHVYDFEDLLVAENQRDSEAERERIKNIRRCCP